MLNLQHTVAEKLAIQIHLPHVHKRKSLIGLFVGLKVGVFVSFNVRMSSHRSEQCWNASMSLQSDSELDQVCLVTIHITLVPALQRPKLIHARNKHIYARE